VEFPLFHFWYVPICRNRGAGRERGAFWIGGVGRDLGAWVVDEYSRFLQVCFWVVWRRGMLVGQGVFVEVAAWVRMRRDLGEWGDQIYGLGIGIVLDCPFARKSGEGKLMADAEECWRIESSSQSLTVGLGRLVAAVVDEM